MTQSPELKLVLEDFSESELFDEPESEVLFSAAAPPSPAAFFAPLRA